ncbi:bifunctional diguanylate cyclase/phosphodiesterase [Piscinibacter sp.]|uniref:bifunctional diguanylate cyclase/phosphodiesterase n=1 Tax=Piscinibacter sp. TaxID=1903157 RepID=UPI002C29C901|nr:EAL domain-containing protein [Albitalea sp.]HUG24270.1 EAL domain-containing protein [Albitalea sp.]
MEHPLHAVTRWLARARPRRLAPRLLAAIFLASTGLALVATAVQLYGDYRNDLEAIDHEFAQIERSTLGALSNSVWSYNETQIELTLAGLLQLRDVEHVEVRAGGDQVFSAGEKADGGAIERVYELHAPSGSGAVLGTLHVQVGLQGVYGRLIERAAIILATESAKAFFVALFILHIVNRWITRHLEHMARHARDLSLDRLGRQPLQLQRTGDDGDELGQVATALNDMSRELARELSRRAAADGERERLFLAYEQNRWLLQAIIDNTPAAIFVRDLQARYLLVNRRYREVFTDGADVVGRRVDEVFPSEQAMIYALADQRAAGSDGFVEHETDVEHGGVTRTYLTQRFPLRRSDGELFAIGCVATDITERKNHEQRIRYLAQNDVLTGLPNRTVFRDRVSQAIVHAQRSGAQVAVMFLDLDHFKNVNDSLGHDTGDELLKAAAARLRGCLRAGDTAARQGGDEFVICLPTLADGQHAIPIAEKLLEALRQPFSVGANELHVRGSLGISLYPCDGHDADALMRAADAAMYHAKEKGRDTFRFFTAELNEAAQRRLGLANRLYEALQRGEFVLHYQPKIDLQSGRICGAEALLRWPQADGSFIAPTEFIRVAEETGLIGALGEWILRDACRQAAAWHALGHDAISLAVNLSPQQLLRPGFPLLAERILQETGLPARLLEIEITEGVLMARSVENMAALEALAALGIRLAIDDFGTGYSSLAYLQRFPVSVLKIDRSFTDGLGTEAGDTAIVTAIIAMAHSLRLDVVAEGVETAEQAAFLRTHGCQAAQGFHFSRAVTPEQFVRLLGAPAPIPHAACRAVLTGDALS